MLVDRTSATVSLGSKVERAKHHIEDLQAAINAFSDPYSVIAKIDPQTSELVYYLESFKPIPDTIPLICGDAIHNLMSALDHLAYRVVMIDTNGCPPKEFGIYFPIGDSAKHYESRRGRKVEGARPETLAAFDALKPYKGGNDLLWALHRLDNIDKHRLVLTITGQFQGINIVRLFDRQFEMLPKDSRPNFGTRVFDSPRIKIMEAGMELFRDRCGAKFDPKLEFGFGIAFNEPEVVKGKSVLETLHQLQNLVENIISAFGCKHGILLDKSP